MIVIKTSLRVDPIVLKLGDIIMDGAGDGAKAIAEGIVKTSQILLEAKVVSGGGDYTGNLAAAISAKNATAGLPGLKQWEVVIDTSRAPYAVWVEMGRRAHVGLPYSKSKTKDYTKSRFGGHWYMRDALALYKDGSVYGPIMAVGIFNRVSQSAALRRL